MLLCPRCQKRNPDRTALCQYCGASMAGATPWGASGAPPAASSLLPGRGGPTSGLAIISVILGLMGLFSLGLTALVGLVLGIVSLVGVSERIADDVLILDFGNSVGMFDVPGLGRIEVVSGKWGRDAFNQMLAVIETATHLELLADRGDLQRTTEPPGHYGRRPR